ncbi:TetR/AcrR family transcriptional regulator [Croceicoccus sp. YJ47]|uniref:TetR/AcrR family transcriptional regulator n=1 Tax=Croceicoccus sp. YJ47 TaxID=2798724 RepID=UPI001F1ED7BA|nr:TetR/AcrR family transcriptional regulator [Croceicoccus sp. YJ47]
MNKTGETPRTDIAEPPATQQSRKSAATRARLVDAVIRCIVTFGYSNITTPRIAQEAGLSRGAMLHHFENGTALIKTAIAELHEKRMRAFRRASDRGHDPADLVQAYWRQVQKPGFIAFHELALAARTDDELAGILHPLQIEFRERFHREAMEMFPEWGSDPARFAEAMALSQTMIEGMAIMRLAGSLNEDMVQPMLTMLEDRIRQLKPAE